MSAKPAATTSVRKPLIDCPACGKEIIATLSLDMKLGELEGMSVPVTATVSGLRVDHDCTPRTIR